MAVIIDTIYQRVLSIVNKEQRGYITPQEFNLFANQAQMDIFEQYFYDLNQLGRMPSVGIEYSDIDDQIDEKLSIFKDIDSGTGVTQTLQNLASTAVAFPVPTQVGSVMYKIGTIWDDNAVEIHKVDHRELTYMINSPLAAPTLARPVYVIDEDQISIFPELNNINISFRYIRTPATAEWGYTVVNEKPMLNPGNTIDFELHASEESDLVFKILQLAGINLREGELYKIAAGEEANEIQQEKR